MEIYIAAPWVRKREAVAAANAVTDAGFTVISRWHDVHGGEEDPAVMAREAQHDIDDLDAANALVLLNLEKSEGKAFETGYMFASGKPVVVVGGRSNVFHWLPEVHVVSSVAAAVELLKGMD